MLKVEALYKNFDDFTALNGLDLNIKKGSIYGLIGVNGSGKTTLIKHITGALVQDEGLVTIEDQDVRENIAIKERLGYIADDLYFLPGYNIVSQAKYIKQLYPNWNQDRFDRMLADFNLPRNKRLAKFSKGMQKQAAFILTMSTMPDYLILDEPVDGLDPIMRKKVWQYIVADVAERQMTVLVSSHNLRELEGLIDSVGILIGGRMRVEKGNLDELESEGGLLSLEELFFEEMEVAANE